MEIFKETKFFLGIAKISIYLLVFLLPLFFLPFSGNVLDFNKQYLLFVLVFLSLICWLASCLISNKLKVNLNFLNYPVIILLLFIGLSTIFSLSRYGSFWGWPLVVSTSFLSLLCLAIFYFLIANIFKKEEISFLFFTLFLSGFLIALFFLFQFFGKFLLPFDFAKNNSFNPIGTVNSLAVYFSILLTLLLPCFFFVKKFFKIILGIFGFVFLTSLFLINFQIAWLALLVGMAVLFVLTAVNLQKFQLAGFSTLVIVFLVIALVLTFFRFSLPGLPLLPLEVWPSQKAGIEILKQLPIKSLILGSGPSTFAHIWSKYKPLDINQTIFWATRFSQGPSEILDRIITSGILGILTFFFLVFVFLKLNLGLLLRTGFDQGTGRTDWLLLLGIFAGFLGTISAFFFYPANLSILFFFWLLIGCLAIFGSKEKTFVLGISPTKSLLFSFLFVLILVLGIGFSILYFQKYLAEVKYVQGIKAWQRGDNVLSNNKLLLAVNLNSKSDLYWRDLSQIYLFRLNEVLTNNKLSQEERNSQAQSFIASSINSANQATNLEPNNIANWNVRAFVYRNMIGILGGADDWAEQYYQKALELESTNPYIYNEIGLIYLAKSDILDQQGDKEGKNENLKLARENFDKAISLKSDYAPAHFQIAMIYVRQGKIPEAIQQLEATKGVAPFDVGLAFQLGLLYYNNNQFDKAKGEFEIAVTLNSNYSNARYFLGLIYDREGKKKEAILQFEKIEELNPDNEEVKKILANLRAGKSALEGVVPGQPPIEEKPAEQLEK